MRIEQKFRTFSQSVSQWVKVICLILFLICISLSQQAQACSDPPPGAPGPSTITSSGYLYAGSYLIYGIGANSGFNTSSTTTYSAGSASVVMTSGPCSPYIKIPLGYVTTTGFTTTQTVTVMGYGASSGVTQKSTASPKNFGSYDPVCSPNVCRGNPINVAVGNKFQIETDFIGAHYTKLELKRYYNSQSGMQSPFGTNWRSTYDRYVSALGPAYTQVGREDGRVDIYTLVNNVWTADPDVTSTLAPVVSGPVQVGWKVVRPDDTTEIYDITGKLLTITTRAGLTTTLAYDANGKLATVTGPFGHTLTYTYNAGGNVATVTAPNGGVFSYTYDANNNLTSVTYPDNTVRQYTYTNATYLNALTGITDENGKAFASFTYSTSPYFPSISGIAVSTQHAGGVENITITYNYNSAKVTNANGHYYTYTLTSQFGIMKPTAISGMPIPDVGGKAFAYDSNGFISSKTDFNNNVTKYTHDTRGNETTRTEAYGTTLARTITTTWDTSFHVPLSITEPNRTTTFTYDAQGNMLTRTVTAGSNTRAWTYTYNSNGQVLTIDGPRTDVSDITTFTYNTSGGLATVTNALNQVTSFTGYDANGRLLSMTDPNGMVTSFTYDARGRLLSRSAGGETTSYTYDNVGNLTRITLPDSSYYSYTYDDAHRLTAIGDSLGNSVAYTLDLVGNVTAKKIYDASATLKWKRDYTYDGVERVATEVGASGQTTTYGYDSNSNLTSVSDPLSHATSFAYDALNRMKQVTDANTKVTQLGYDANDHLTSVTDPRSLVTSYTVTGLDNVTGLTSPDSGATTKTYDSAGNAVTVTDARGSVTTYTFDALNRRTGATYQDGTVASWTYDQGTYGKGHLTSMSDATGTTTWTYDIHGRVTQKQQSTGAVTLTTAYAYDGSGRLSGITYPSGRAIALSYDAGGRVSGITSGGTQLVSGISYLPFGGVTGWTAGNGLSYSRTLDLDGRIASIGMGGTALGYTLDSADRITGLTETGQADKSFGYDNLDRLTSFENGTASTSYGYDVDGNRTSVTNGQGSVTYSYPGSSNRLSGLSGLMSATYSYDNAGNLTGDGTNAWSYDVRGRMASHTAGGVTTSYGINGLGQRVTKSGAAVQPSGGAEYVYDGRGHVLGTYDASGGMLDETVWLGDMPVAVLKGTGGSAATYYVGVDHLNAPHIITNSSGASVWVWDHLAFGDNAPNQNPSGLGVFSYGARFPGQMADGESGLNYNMFRDYAPYQGRYVQSDPIGLAGTSWGSLNTYGYVGGNPVTRIDPKGEFWPELIAIPIVLIGYFEYIVRENYELENVQIIKTNPTPYWVYQDTCTKSNPSGMPILVGGPELRNFTPVPERVDPPEGDVPERTEQTKIPQRMFKSSYPATLPPRPWVAR